jgi:hypothetical protein
MSEKQMTAGKTALEVAALLDAGEVPIPVAIAELSARKTVRIPSKTLVAMLLKGHPEGGASFVEALTLALAHGKEQANETKSLASTVAALHRQALSDPKAKALLDKINAFAAKGAAA